MDLLTDVSTERLLRGNRGQSGPEPEEDGEVDPPGPPPPPGCYAIAQHVVSSKWRVRTGSGGVRDAKLSCLTESLRRRIRAAHRWNDVMFTAFAATEGGR